jgi:transmembrane sensor
MRPHGAHEPALDPAVVEQAMLWLVRLQSGVCSEAEQLACQRWRTESSAHELAWQRLNGLGQGLRESTHGLSAQGARQLLQARTQVSRRAVLNGLVGAGVLIAGGYSLQQRTLLPTLFSDYTTRTGERRSWRLQGDIALQLDTGSALDIEGPLLTLNRGRLLLELGENAEVRLRSAQVLLKPAQASRLVVRQLATTTQVQLLKGAALVEYGQGARQELAAGWQQRFSAAGAEPPQPLNAAATAWTQGQLVAERMPLTQLLAELDRYRPGILRCDPRIAGLRVSGTFSVDQPDASLELLTEVLPVRVQRVLGYWAQVVPV